MPSTVNREDKSDKLDYTLIPLEYEERVVKHFMFGARKYARDDWKNYTGKDDRLERLASLHRHLRALQRCETDEDHAAAVIVNAYILMHIDTTAGTLSQKDIEELIKW